MLGGGLDERQLCDFMEHGRRPPLRTVRLRALLRLLPLTPFVLRLLAGMGRLEQMTRETESRMSALLSRLRREPLAAMADERLLALIRLDARDIREELLAMPPANALARGLSPAALSLLAWICEHWCGEPDAPGVLLSGLPDFFEVDCAQALWTLAAEARRTPSVADTLRGDAASAVARLAGRPEASAFLAALLAFLQRFGHRAIEEVELFRPRWAEDPTYVLRVVAGYIDHPPPEPAAEHERRRAQREALEARLRHHLRWRPIRRVVFDVVRRAAQQACVGSENTKSDIMRLMQLVREAILERGRRLVAAGRLRRAADAFFLTLEELAPTEPGDLRALADERRACWLEWQRDSAPRLIDARGRAVIEPQRPSATHPDTLAGIGASPGIARGRVRVVLDPAAGARLSPDDVLVAPFTDPAWTPLFLCVRAVVVETGSLLSHASIVARELRVPCVAGLPNATRRLRDGEEIEVDGSRGTVRRLGRHTMRG
jgi:pyruvate,water dikinase